MQDHQQTTKTPVPGGQPDDSCDVPYHHGSNAAKVCVRFAPGQVAIKVSTPGSPGGTDELVHRNSLESTSADLLELSDYEATLAVSSRIELGEFVFLNLVLKEIELDLDLFADVRSLQSAEDGTWLIRCAFYPELPADVLSRLAARSYRERRVEPCYEVRLPVAVRWESGHTDGSATLQNYSGGGFGVLTASAEPTGGRLCMDMDHGGSVWSTEAESRWRFKTEEGHLVGCAFVDDK